MPLQTVLMMPDDIGGSMSWKFDVSTFMVLLGEEEESHYRLIRRGYLEILSAAPVAGLQSYLWDKSKVTERQGPNYISPYGCKIAPLRNMRVARLISVCDLLEDGALTVYRIHQPQAEQDYRAWKILSRIIKSPLRFFLLAATWMVFGILIAMAVTIPSVTWIGMVNLAALSVWSIALRLIDRYVLTPASCKPSHPDRPDAVVFLGRRNSAVVLEGSRKDVALWTGTGLQCTRSLSATWLQYAQRLGTVCLLIFIFCTVPNGSTEDQILFIAFNLLGQFTTWSGQRLDVRQVLRQLQVVEKLEVPTRTHVYASLIRRFGSGEWVDAANLLPHSETWDMWRTQITESTQDAKVWWETCESQCCPRGTLSSAESWPVERDWSPANEKKAQTEHMEQI